MRRYGLVFLLALCGLAQWVSVGCSGSGPSEAPAGGVSSAVDLPALGPGDTVVWEDGFLRVVIGPVVEAEGGMDNTLRVQHKTDAGENFTLRGSVLFLEAVVGNSVVVSEGTDQVRGVDLYDARTGAHQLSLEYPTADLPMEVEDKSHFAYYRYDSDAPSVYWDEGLGRWVESEGVLPAMRNASLEEAKARVADYLFDGLTLQPYERVRVDVEALRAEPAGVYVWGVCE